MSEEKKKTGFLGRLFKRNRLEDKPQEKTATGEDDVQELQSEHPEETESDRKIVDATSEDQDEARNLLVLKTGLTKTRKGFLKSLDGIFAGKKELDEQVLGRLEEVLLRADIGVQTSYELLEQVTDRVKRREIDDPAKVIKHIRDMVRQSLEKVESPLRVGYGTEPFVIMVIGVNGSGKTTTIAKIAARHTAANRKVMLVAGDTFRAAAVEQLQIWGG